MATQTKLIASESFSEQVRRQGLPSTECPCREMLKDVTSPWGILLLIVLMGEVRRFSELRRMVGGVSEKMLSQTLKRLEAHGLVHRKSYGTVPPHVEYSLTPRGRILGERVEALADCIDTMLPDSLDARRSPPFAQTRLS
ncbi:transcriptional regulator, HxlR family [Collimonas sp. OK607]|uniref:winged helix-turn-helix transcriptional regulator n=1 Tax=Collimonas sp. OK607 TaxID=1798194 RepID=UPI0008F36ED1|nr:helix-turn-helix domain-containing protein [Collimonas sp. OK607]SFB04154.1 transcriptional regulator, HxlR family [Collimonas sp. OK607]